MKISEAKDLLERYGDFKKKAGDLAWSRLTLQQRIGWSRYPCSIYFDDEEIKDRLVVEFTDNIEGYQTTQVLLSAEDLENL